VSAETVADVIAPFSAVLTTKDKGKLALVAAVGEATFPALATVLERPNRDKTSLRAEASEIETELKNIGHELCVLAGALATITDRRAELQTTADFQSALGGAHTEEALFAVQGWVPKRDVDKILPALEAKSIPAATNTLEPTDDEAPPSLVEYPTWVKPIKALFGVLGTIPGYREFDPSMIFMLAMPIFAAMLIGDAGYGLIFAAAGFFTRKKLRAATGDSAAGSMIIIFGLATFAYGALTGNYFGLSPWDMISAGSIFEPLGNVLKPLAALVSLNADGTINADSGNTITLKISFGLAGGQLFLAHFIQAIRLLPSQKGIAEAGWSVFFVGMFALVWGMFDLGSLGVISDSVIWILLAGFALVALFSHPSKNPITRLAMGVLTNLMPTINTFGDTLSYIRLMAVGMASYYMAVAFNGLAMQVAGDGGVLWVPAVLILLAAHGLNIFLCIIAVLAHGVRLNLLEFSGNAGVEWAGYAYQPFAITNKA
ncbi:MAG: hypothetical protein HN909_00060, partial [Phycisphaerales bacterium]|nr:hypothetical protein [Phycisphaerales bacterium]